MSKTLEDHLAPVRALLPELAERGAEIEDGRRIPMALVDKLKAAGCFRMAPPKAVGGEEFDLPSRIEVVETLAAADASTAWTVAINFEAPIILSRCTQAAFEAIYANGPDVAASGGAAPTGFADVVEGGYVASGRWAWGSGSLHADWLMGQCVIRQNGEVRQVAPGIPQMRLMVVPKAEAEVLDTWRPGGLAGTGSNDFVFRELFVPADRTVDYLGGASCLPGSNYRCPPIQGGMHFAGVALGVARGALNDVVALAKGQKRRMFTAGTMAGSELFQFGLGQAELSLQAARGLLYQRAREFAAQAEAIPPGPAQMVHPLSRSCRATAAWVVRRSIEVVDFAYGAAGGSSVPRSSALQRRFRDIHTLSQHIAVADSSVAGFGAWLADASA
ncbi:MAG: acyl-CoA dehydrogenase family protein [Caulobacteraceae bacterium]